jgi:hypothetical protein
MLTRLDTHKTAESNYTQETTPVYFSTPTHLTPSRLKMGNRQYLRRQWLPHFIVDEAQQVVVGKSTEITVRVQSLGYKNAARQSQTPSAHHTVAHLFLCLPDDSQRDRGAEIPNASQAWVHESLGLFLGVQGRREGDGRSFDHAVRDVARIGENRAEADAGEDVHVVPLPGFVSHPVVRHGLVRAARRKDDLAVGPGGRLSEMPG